MLELNCRIAVEPLKRWRPALSFFAATHSGDVRWGIVAVPPNGVGQGAGPTLVTDFTDAKTFASHLNGQQGAGGSDEPTLDALFDIYGRKPTLPLSWRQGSSKVLLQLADEEAQSLRGLKTADVLQEIQKGLLVAKLVAYTDPMQVASAPSYEPLAKATGGWVDDVTSTDIPKMLTRALGVANCP